MHQHRTLLSRIHNHHHTLLTRIHHHHRHLHLLTESPKKETPLLTYLEHLDGLTIPDPKYAETIIAIPRDASGASIAAKLRKLGRAPGIVSDQHGGYKRLISVNKNQIKKLINHMGQPFFCSRLFDLEVRRDLESDEIIEKVRVLPRMLHLHPETDTLLNVTFLRTPSSALLEIDVPLLFRGEDASPGLKKGAYLSTKKKTVKFLCPADILPPYIEVDLSELDVGQKIVMADLKVHPALKLLQPKEEPVCSCWVTKLLLKFLSSPSLSRAVKIILSSSRSRVPSNEATLVKLKVDAKRDLTSHFENAMEIVTDCTVETVTTRSQHSANSSLEGMSVEGESSFASPLPSFSDCQSTGTA